MKKIALLTLGVIGIALLSGSCQKITEPEFSTPKYTGSPANITISDVKNIWRSNGEDAAHVDSVKLANGKDPIFCGVVVSSDEGGNFYKSMVIQDSLGNAIELELDASGLYTEYAVGQKVYVNCKGLCVDMYGKKISGTYYGYFRLGWIYQDAVGQISNNYIKNYIFKDGMPDKKNLDTLKIDASNCFNIESACDLSTDPNVSRLVTLKNCRFAEEAIGKPLSGDLLTTNHYIYSIDGIAVSKFVVRTSNYAKIRDIVIPDAPVTLTGILSKYGKLYQLELRTREDFQAQE